MRNQSFYRFPAILSFCAFPALVACAELDMESPGDEAEAFELAELSDESSLTSSEVEVFDEASDTALLACATYNALRCYWMENTSGQFCWIPATWVDSFDECRRQDSCSPGGGGASGGGCYKWSEGSEGAPYPWRP